MEDVLKDLCIQPPMQLDTVSGIILLSFQIILIMQTACQLQLDLSVVINLLVMLVNQALINAILWQLPLTNANVLTLLVLSLLAKTPFVFLLEKQQDGLNFLLLALRLTFQTAALEICASTNIATLLTLIPIQWVRDVSVSVTQAIVTTTMFALLILAVLQLDVLTLFFLFWEQTTLVLDILVILSKETSPQTLQQPIVLKLATCVLSLIALQLDVNPSTKAQLLLEFSKLQLIILETPSLSLDVLHQLMLPTAHLILVMRRLELVSIQVLVDASTILIAMTIMDATPQSAPAINASILQ
jgi:hypothetical protein